MAANPPTFAQVEPGQFITSALWNAQVVAAGRYLLGSGTDGPPRFKGYSSSAQSVPSGTTAVAIALDTEVFDSAGGHSSVTNTSRYTVQVPGLYLSVGQVGFGQSSVGMRAVKVVVNGVTTAPGQGGNIELPSANNMSSWVGQVASMDYLDVGDFVEVQAWQSSGAAMALPTGATAPSLSCYWLSN